MTQWIEDWFGSAYYSLLYKHRDDKEAQLFLDNILTFLNIPSGSKILDCGCGKGRHSIYLSKKGFQVTGLDISEPNILESKKSENQNLVFFTHDMRNLFRINFYDAALSLFTSFGYFDKDPENNKVIRSISGAIKKDGWLVLDYMNAEKETKKLTPEENIEIEGIKFRVTRCTKNNCIIKEITVDDKGKHFSFRENVKAYSKKDLEFFLKQNGIETVHLFGDYDLKPFEINTSDRLIVIGKKK